jgi:hypothetical protein
MVSDAKLQVNGPMHVGIVPHTHWDREWSCNALACGDERDLRRDLRKHRSTPLAFRGSL